MNPHYQALLNGLVRTTPRPLLKIVVDVADHCNLNCRGCDHFSPIAAPGFVEPEAFEEDMIRLCALMENRMERIGLMGGEPLLHPQLGSLITTARKYFPDTELYIVTNGLLLPKQDESFWKLCASNNVSIEITQYPVNFNYSSLRSDMQTRGVKHKAYGNTDSLAKTTYFLPFDLSGCQDSRQSFLNCMHANSCIQLKNGRLYTCTVAANADRFNNYFGTKLSSSSGDYIDIYKAQSANEVLDFLARPIPFCRFCNVDGRTFNHTWGQSEKSIAEWVEWPLKLTPEKLAEYPDIIIYGADGCGTRLKQIMDLLPYKFNIRGWAVTDSAGLPDEKEGIPVNPTFDRLHPKNHKKCKKAHFSNSRNPENSRFLSFESPEF
ncbi:MAG: radical SAM protein, partial [Clostridiales bacterium]|nr:radical SAM protein [Clostridiales bacterium]